MVVLRGHEEPIEACPSDLVSADNVVTAADGVQSESKADARLARANDIVSNDHVPLSLVNPDPAPVAERVIAGDQVPDPVYDDAGALVPSAGIAPDLIVVRLHEDSWAGVARDYVLLDQVAGGVLNVKAERVVPERVVHDADVMRAEQPQPV